MSLSADILFCLSYDIVVYRVMLCCWFSADYNHQQICTLVKKDSGIISTNPKNGSKLYGKNGRIDVVKISIESVEFLLPAAF